MFNRITTSAAFLNLALIIFLGSCTNNDNKIKEATNPENTIANTPKSSGQSSLLTGNLHVLWIDAATFSNSNRRIVFRFYAEAPDSLTLHGWTNDSDTFPDPADIKMKMGDISNIKYGNKSYFGNLILTGGPNGDRKKIKDIIIANHSKYVLFVPHDSTNVNYPSVPAGQITYDIKLTNVNPGIMEDSSGVAPAPSETNVILNPSPPRKPK